MNKQQPPQQPKRQEVVIPAPNMVVTRVRIRGNAPLVVDKFSSRIWNKIKETQEQGARSRGKKVREPKNFEALWREACYISTEGWYGINAAAFRNAMISACPSGGSRAAE